MARTAHGSLHTDQVARKSHPCGWECGDPIEPGTRYIRSAMPPHVEPNESDHWWTPALHGPTLYHCPVYASRSTDTAQYDKTPGEGD